MAPHAEVVTRGWRGVGVVWGGEKYESEKEKSGKKSHFEILGFFFNFSGVK